MDSKHNIVAYKQLSPEEIDVMLRDYPGPKDEQKRLQELYRGVDGRTVTDEKNLLHPSFLANRAEEKDMEFEQAVSPSPGPDVLAELRRPDRKKCHAISCHNYLQCQVHIKGCTKCTRNSRVLPNPGYCFY